MDRELTFLERGVFVKITQNELEKIENLTKGFLPRSAYPEKYEKIAHEKEVGRFHIFRFIQEV